MYISKILPILICMLLVSPVIAQKQCVSGSEYINILSKNEYAIGENIGNVKIRLNSDAFDFATATVTALLLEGDIERGTRLSNGFVNQLGEITIDFDYNHPKSGELTIQVIVKDNQGNQYQTSKKISVLPTLDTKMTCDLVGYIGRNTKCSWKTYSIETGDLVTSTPTISVKQGGIDLVYNPTSSTSFEFATETSGSVEISLITSKDGYISDEDTTTISIQNLQRTQNLYIDNKDFFSYVDIGITTGIHQLLFKIEESDIPIDVQIVEAEIRPPSGQEIPITFFKGTQTGDYKSTYNFEQGGQTYDLSGRIIFKEIEKEPIPFQYKINTLKSLPEEKKSLIIWIILGASLGVVVLIIVLTILFRRK